MLLQIFLRNFRSNGSCFSLLWLYLGNSLVSVYRTIGLTLVSLSICCSSNFHFGFEDKILVLFVPVPGHCLPFTFECAVLLKELLFTCIIYFYVASVHAKEPCHVFFYV